MQQAPSRKAGLCVVFGPAALAGEGSQKGSNGESIVETSVSNTTVRLTATIRGSLVFIDTRRVVERGDRFHFCALLKLKP